VGEVYKSLNLIIGEISTMADSKIKKDILDRAFKVAEGYEKKCTGCAQTTLAGIFDTLEMWSDDAFKAASGLADGIGLTGDGSCGALTGGAMAIGLVFGREKKDFKDPLKSMKSYLLAKELHQDFIQRYGSCRCYDIQEKLMGRTFNLLDQNELKEAFKFGMMDHCSKVVGNAARKTVEIILNNKKDDG
jgi:C_GCAxxG_C_C family probable redox protein